MIRLAEPGFLLLALLVLGAGAWLLWRRRPLRPRMRWSSMRLFTGTPSALRTRLLGLPAVLVFVAALLVALALARPQSAWREHTRFAEGIDIMLVIDVSDSMHALDFSPNRLEKAKAVVKDFVAGRSNDRIGLVIFGRDTFTVCPLTQDYAALETFIDRIRFGLVNGDGTAIGMGLLNAVARLRESDAPSRVAVLLTDGENNAGRIDPIDAAGVAERFGVRLYTIGVGSEAGYVDMPNPNAFGPRVIRHPSQLDIKQLTEIATMTGGRFFHATDGESLEKIYREIDQLERVEYEVAETHYFDDLGHWLMLPALGLLLLGLALEQSWLRTFP